jgi:hypothetical protein
MTERTRTTKKTRTTVRLFDPPDYRIPAYRSLGSFIQDEPVIKKGTCKDPVRRLLDLDETVDGDEEEEEEEEDHGASVRPPDSSIPAYF